MNDRFIPAAVRKPIVRAAECPAAADRPLTSRQRSAVMLEFTRLDLAHPAWRRDRLNVAAALLGRPVPGSVKDLTMGEAGQLIATLRGCRDTRDLAVLLARRAAGKR